MIKTVILFLAFTTSFSVALSQNIPDMEVSLINNLIEQRKYDLALEHCNSLLIDYDTFPEIYVLKATSMMKGKNDLNYDEDLFLSTLAVLNKAISLDSTYNHAWGRRGLLHLINRHPAQAVHDYTKCIELSTLPEDLFNCYTDRGVAKSYLQDFNGAINDYAKALNYDSTDISIYVNLSAIYAFQGAYENGIDILKKGISIFPTSAVLYNNMGFLLLKMEMYSEAITNFSNSLKLDPNESLALGNRGFCFVQLGKLDQGKADIDKSLEINPNNSYAYRHLAYYYLAKKDTKKACNALYQAEKMGFEQLYGDEVEQLIKQHCK